MFPSFRSSSNRTASARPVVALTRRLGLVAALTVGAAGALGAQQTTTTTKTDSTKTVTTKTVSHHKTKHHKRHMARHESRATERREVARAEERREERRESEARIPVRKGEEMAMAPDTVRMVRVDTVVVRQAETNTVYRTDTLYQTRMMMPPKHYLPGFYAGLGLGAAVPMNSWRNSTKDGLDLHGHLGYFPHDMNLGVRGAVDYAMFNRRDTDCPNCPKPRLLSGSGDLVLRMPLDRRSRLNPVLYVLGGGGVDKFTNFLPYRDTEGNVVTAGSDTYRNYPGLTLNAGNGVGGVNGTTQTGYAGDRSTFYHYDVGPGLAFKVGPANMFVEGKYTTINTVGGRSHYWPIVAGLNFQ